jgi:hypothetical protein
VAVEVNPEQVSATTLPEASEPDHQFTGLGNTPASRKLLGMLPPSRVVKFLAKTTPLGDSMGRLLGTP